MVYDYVKHFEVLNVFFLTTDIKFLSLLPPKLMREWKTLFFSGQPLFEEAPADHIELTAEQVLEEERLQLLDEGDFMEYKVRTFTLYTPDTEVKKQ